MDQVEELQACLSIKKNELEQKNALANQKLKRDGEGPAGGGEEEGDLTGDPGAAQSADTKHQVQESGCTGGSCQDGASCQRSS